MESKEDDLAIDTFARTMGEEEIYFKSTGDIIFRNGLDRHLPNSLNCKE